MAAKSISKSVRLSPELYSYIDGYRGGNFSDKLSNLVYDAWKGERRRKERFRELDAMIAEKEGVYDEVRQNISAIQQIGCHALYIERNMNALYEETKQLVAGQRRPPGKPPPGGSA